MRQRQPSHKSKKYLAWAKSQHSTCCLCRYNPGSNLHHLEPGLGKKGSDLLVCRLCVGCHAWAEGKRRIALERINRLDAWADMLTDCLVLLSMYTEKIELANSDVDIIF